MNHEIKIGNTDTTELEQTLPNQILRNKGLVPRQARAAKDSLTRLELGPEIFPAPTSRPQQPCLWSGQDEFDQLPLRWALH